MIKVPRRAKQVASCVLFVILSAGCGEARVDLATEKVASSDESDEMEQRAENSCETVGKERALRMGTVEGISNAHPAKMGDFVNWEESRFGPDGPQPGSPYGDREPDSFVALCYYDGEFSGIPKGPPDEMSRGPYKRVAIAVVEDNETRLLSAGYEDTLDNHDAPPSPE